LTYHLHIHEIPPPKMYGLSSLAILAFFANTAVAALNDTTEYRLKTELKPHDGDKRLFENLVSGPDHLSIQNGPELIV
jgi:hypothetical protein